MPSAPVYDAQTAALGALYSAEVARAVDPQRQSERWLVAADRLERSQLPWEAAYAKYRAADALLSYDNDRRRGADLLRRGLVLADALQAEPVTTQLRALARRARIPLAEPTAARLPDGLVVTARERDVLSLLVAGRTYAEIARALFISEKTVSTHVSHLLAKTGTANRVELAGLTERAAGIVAE